MDSGLQEGRDAAARLGDEELQRSSEVFINDLDAIRVLELEKRGLPRTIRGVPSWPPGSRS